MNPLLPVLTQITMLRNTSVYSVTKKSLSSRLLKILCLSWAVRCPDTPRIYIPEQEQKKITHVKELKCFILNTFHFRHRNGKNFKNGSKLLKMKCVLPSKYLTRKTMILPHHAFHNSFPITCAEQNTLGVITRKIYLVFCIY